jgi:hypothetical protein
MCLYGAPERIRTSDLSLRSANYPLSKLFETRFITLEASFYLGIRCVSSCRNVFVFISCSAQISAHEISLDLLI